MNKTIGFQLVAYGLILAGLSYLAHHLAPAWAKPALIAGLAGGALSLIWGARAIAGCRGKALPILTLIPIIFLMVAQTVTAWWGGTEGMEGGRGAAVVITLLSVLSLGMLMRVAYAGEVFDGQPAEQVAAVGANTQRAPKPAVMANAAKRA